MFQLINSIWEVVGALKRAVLFGVAGRWFIWSLCILLQLWYPLTLHALPTLLGEEGEQQSVFLWK